MNNISRAGLYSAPQPPQMRPVAPKQTSVSQTPQQPAQSMSAPQASPNSKINYLA